MNAAWIRKTIASRYAWSAAGGLLLTASFPKVGIAGLAWIAPGWILFCAVGKTPGEAFRIGYVAGLAYALAAFYWLLRIPFPAGAVGGWLALSAYLALYPAAWAWLCWWGFPLARVAGPAVAGPRAREGTWEPPVEEASDSTSPAGKQPSRSDLFRELERFFLLPLRWRIVWVFGCAALWVALEMILARLFTGFPWNLLGVSQYRMLPLIQIASVTGVYGVSFLVAWFSVALVTGALKLWVHPTRSRPWLGDLLLPLLALLTVIAFGSDRLGQRSSRRHSLKTLLIQPSIPQTLIWDTNQNTVRFEQLIALSERALAKSSNAQLLVWPEAAVPNMLRYEPETYRAVTNLTVRHGVWMILGSDDAEPRPGSQQGEYDVFNSSFLVTPQGEVAAAYRKRMLVIFGEYIPLERWLPFMKYLTPVGGSFAAGSRPMPFRIPELKAKISVLICFEDIFPHIGREYVDAETDFLLNLTNNGWFGESAAQWQHAANAVFRTVENRVPLVRCANNGLTCWVDEYGGMHQIYFPGSKDVYGVGFKTVDVPLLSSRKKRSLTFYTRHGDWLGWGCVSAAVLILGSFGAVRRLREREIIRAGRMS